jgi:hypothetical protein
MKQTDRCYTCGHIRKWHCSPIKSDKGCIVMMYKNKEDKWHSRNGTHCSCDYFVFKGKHKWRDK